jgi:hypothetical protein
VVMVERRYELDLRCYWWFYLISIWNSPNIIIITLVLFFVAALMEIGGGYLVWQWLREKKGTLIGLTWGIILFYMA